MAHILPPGLLGRLPGACHEIPEQQGLRHLVWRVSVLRSGFKAFVDWGQNR